MNKAHKETLEELMKKDGVNVTEAEDKADAIDLEEPKKRTWLVVLLTVLATLLILGGAYVAYQSYSADKELTAEEKIENETTKEQASDTNVSTQEQVIYTTASEGLNMRKEASSTSEVIKVIPYGTKLTVLETNGDWYKVEFENVAGWCAKIFTAAESPLPL